MMLSFNFTHRPAACGLANDTFQFLESKSHTCAQRGIQAYRSRSGHRAVKALDSVESFLFFAPEIFLFASEVSTLVAPAICTGDFMNGGTPPRIKMKGNPTEQLTWHERYTDLHALVGVIYQINYKR